MTFTPRRDCIFFLLMINFTFSPEYHVCEIQHSHNHKRFSGLFFFFVLVDMILSIIVK